MKKASLLLLFIVIFAACSKSPERPFSEKGVSFTCPAGWKIDETTDSETSFDVYIEKEGLNESGLVILLAFDEDWMAEEYRELYLLNMEDNAIFGKLKLGEEKADTYGSYSGSSVAYTASVLGEAHQGKVFVFKSGERSCCVVQQEALEDQKKNKEGFDLIARTLEVTAID